MGFGFEWIVIFVIGLPALIVLIGLPALIVLIGGPILLFVKGGKVGRAIVGGLLILLLLSFLMLFSYKAVSHTPRAVSHTPVTVRLAEQPVDATPAIWSEGLEDRFIADIYPSKESAARALGRQLPEFFSSVLPVISKNAQPDSASDKPARPTVIQIYSIAADELLPTDTLHALADGIRQANENLKVLVETTPPAKRIEQTVPAAITIRVSCSIRNTSNVLSSRWQSGMISIEISGRAGQISRSIDFTEKPWVENYSDFVNQFPQRNWAIVRSQEACTSSTQATQQADRAVQQYITQKMRDQGILQQNEPLNLFVQDRFVQSLDGSAGRIWREAVLLEISPEKLQKLNKTVYQKRIKRSSYLAKKLFSAAGLLVLICLVYLFLNAATKGYYVWSLRIAAVVIGAAIIIFLLKFS